MKDYEKQIEKHEQEIKKLKQERKQARQLDPTITDQIYKAFDMGFNVNHVSEAFGIDKREVRLVQKRRATGKRLQTGKTFKRAPDYRGI